MRETPESLGELLAVLKVLGSETRLRILSMLAERPMHAYEIMKELGVSYPIVLMHLNALRRVGLVEEAEAERGGRRRKYYRAVSFRLVLTPEVIREVVEGGGTE